jgi:hypothetical protein
MRFWYLLYNVDNCCVYLLVIIYEIYTNSCYFCVLKELALVGFCMLALDIETTYVGLVDENGNI